MTAPSDPISVPQLQNLRDAAVRALSESLGDPAARGALVASGEGDESKSDKLRELYDSFETLVTRATDDVIATWSDKHGLSPKIAAVAQTRAMLEHGGTAATPAQREAAYREQVLTQKRAELARITDAIREEETASAHMRVELAQQKDVVAGLVNKIRSRGNTIEKNCNCGRRYQRGEQ